MLSFAQRSFMIILTVVLPALLWGCAANQLVDEQVCSLQPSDRAWLNRSVAGWIATRTHLLVAKAPKMQDAVVFDDSCQLRSSQAMLTGKPRWTASNLTGNLISVGKQQIPVGVVSATVGDGGGTRFVMSVPSVWSKAKVPPGVLGLEQLMSAVMMHEATHVFQMNTYGKDIEALQADNHLNDAQFNDDAIQNLFQNDAEFAKSIKQETELFFAAADAQTDEDALRWARAGRAMMKKRSAKYFIGDQAYQTRAEGLWLTMEGSAQWAGYRWLQMPTALGGAGAGRADAMTGFGRRGQSWTQLLGLAITLSVDRLTGDTWKRRVFGDGKQTVLQILDQSIARKAAALK